VLDRPGIAGLQRRRQLVHQGLALIDEIAQSGTQLRLIRRRHDGERPGGLRQGTGELLECRHGLGMLGALGIGEGGRVGTGHDLEGAIERGRGMELGARLRVIRLADGLYLDGRGATAGGQETRQGDKGDEQREAPGDRGSCGHRDRCYQRPRRPADSAERFGLRRPARAR
jgi:hypothetical protein